MNALPAEILLEIGRVDKQTYRGMLAIPRFARAVSVGYRLDIMVGNYKHERIINFHMTRKRGSHISKLLSHRSIITNRLYLSFIISDHDDNEKYTYYYVGPYSSTACGVIHSIDNGSRTMNSSQFYGGFNVSQHGTLY